jgi:hypothetical protein
MLEYVPTTDIATICSMKLNIGHFRTLVEIGCNVASIPALNSFNIAIAEQIDLGIQKTHY